mgnify:CR=1 FL=1
MTAGAPAGTPLGGLSTRSLAPSPHHGAGCHVSSGRALGRRIHRRRWDGRWGDLRGARVVRADHPWRCADRVPRGRRRGSADGTALCAAVEVVPTQRRHGHLRQRGVRRLCGEPAAPRDPSRHETPVSECRNSPHHAAERRGSVDGGPRRTDRGGDQARHPGALRGGGHLGIAAIAAGARAVEFSGVARGRRDDRVPGL